MDNEITFDQYSRMVRGKSPAEIENIKQRYNIVTIHNSKPLNRPPGIEQVEVKVKPSLSSNIISEPVILNVPVPKITDRTIIPSATIPNADIAGSKTRKDPIDKPARVEQVEVKVKPATSSNLISGPVMLNVPVLKITDRTITPQRPGFNADIAETKIRKDPTGVFGTVRYSSVINFLSRPENLDDISRDAKHIYTKKDFDIYKNSLKIFLLIQKGVSDISSENYQSLTIDSKDIPDIIGVFITTALDDSYLDKSIEVEKFTAFLKTYGVK